MCNKSGQGGGKVTVAIHASINMDNYYIIGYIMVEGRP